MIDTYKAYFPFKGKGKKGKEFEVRASIRGTKLPSGYVNIGDHITGFETFFGAKKQEVKARRLSGSTL